MNLDHLEYDSSKSGWGHLHPTEEVLSMFEMINEICAPKRVLEIGFFVGHSTTYMLELFPQATVTTYGMCKQFSEQKDKMEAKYPNRVKVNYEESWKLFGKHHGIDTFDFAFVDGSHNEYMAANDILHCLMLGAKWILVDNCEQEQVLDDIAKFDKCLDLHMLFNYTATHKGKTTLNQCRLYYVRTDDIQELIRQQDR